MKKPINVLLIEDNTDDQFFFAEALREIEDTVLYSVANNGQEALDILRNSISLPDIIFTDINMPVMDGLEFLAEILNDPRLKNIPVLILSSNISVTAMARHLGAKAFIKKPISVSLLREHLEKMLNLDLSADNPIAFQTFEDAHRAPFW